MYVRVLHMHICTHGDKMLADRLLTQQPLIDATTDTQGAPHELGTIPYTHEYAA
jgi:hypothetical protein